MERVKANAIIRLKISEDNTDHKMVAMSVTNFPPKYETDLAVNFDTNGKKINAVFGQVFVVCLSLSFFFFHK